MAAEPPPSKPHVDVVRALKDAALAGLLAFGLFLPLHANSGGGHAVRGDLCRGSHNHGPGAGTRGVRTDIQ